MRNNRGLRLIVIECSSPRSESHLSRGSDEDTQRLERGLGSVMTFSSERRNSGAAAAMYLLWKATPELLTRRANVPSADSIATNFSSDSTGPEICVTRFVS